MDRLEEILGADRKARERVRKAEKAAHAPNGHAMPKVEPKSDLDVALAKMNENHFVAKWCIRQLA